MCVDELCYDEEPVQLAKVKDVEDNPQNSHLGKLFRKQRGAVVASLAAATQRFRIGRKELCRALAKVQLSDGKPTDNGEGAGNEGTTVSKKEQVQQSRQRLVREILGMDATTNTQAGKGRGRQQQHSHDNRLNGPGCATLAKVFAFPFDCYQQLGDSLCALDEQSTLRLAKDPGGSRVLEAFLRGEAPAKLKD